jgi:hypothetical protein
VLALLLIPVFLVVALILLFAALSADPVFGTLFLVAFFALAWPWRSR